MKLRVTQLERHTKDAISVYFKNPFLRKVKYIPGQFLTVCFEIDGRMEKRAYSFSSNPYTDSFLRITVKRVDGGLVSNHINDSLRVGDKVQVEKPMGSFYLEPNPDEQRQIVLFGAGSGITPVHSIGKSILDQEPNSKVLLFYANKNIESIIFKEEIAALEQQFQGRFNVVHILEEKAQRYGDCYHGYINNSVIMDAFSRYRIMFLKARFFMCGPAPFMDGVKEMLRRIAVPLDFIKMEAFTAPVRVSVKDKDFKSDVTIRKNGTSVHSIKVKGNKTLLQGGLAKNVDMPYSCRSGQCNTCKAKCVEGEVTMPDGHMLTDQELADGYILTCISSPRTEKVVIQLP